MTDSTTGSDTFIETLIDNGAQVALAEDGQIELAVPAATTEPTLTQRLKAAGEAGSDDYADEYGDILVDYTAIVNELCLVLGSDALVQAVADKSGVRRRMVRKAIDFAVVELRSMQ
jgi:hypothetical protein